MNLKLMMAIIFLAFALCGYIVWIIFQLCSIRNKPIEEKGVETNE